MFKNKIPVKKSLVKQEVKSIIIKVGAATYTENVSLDRGMAGDP